MRPSDGRRLRPFSYGMYRFISFCVTKLKEWKKKKEIKLSVRTRLRETETETKSASKRDEKNTIDLQMINNK